MFFSKISESSYPGSFSVFTLLVAFFLFNLGHFDDFLVLYFLVHTIYSKRLIDNFDIVKYFFEPLRYQYNMARNAQPSIVAYHPSKSRVSEDAFMNFIRAEIIGDLLEVPGIGKASKKILIEAGVSTTFQLLGKFLSLKGEDVGPIEHCDRFYYWLCSIGTSPGHRAGTVHCIAEKLNIHFQGIYNTSNWDEESPIVKVGGREPMHAEQEAR